MNMQQIFDTVLTHMREQKLPARNNGNCQYYDEATNRKCDIGCLIPTTKYRPIFDTADITEIQANILVQRALETLGIDINKGILDFLDDLQTIHDSIDGEWGDREENEMKEVAVGYSLQYMDTQFYSINFEICH